MAEATKKSSTPRRPASSRRKSTAKSPARSVVDPIFEAIKNHHKLDFTYMKLAREADSILDNRAVDRAAEAEQTAIWKLARTTPTTAAGAAAMLDYITFGYCLGLFTLGECAWNETAFRTVVAALGTITSQSPASLLEVVRAEKARRQQAA